MGRDKAPRKKRFWRTGIGEEAAIIAAREILKYPMDEIWRIS
jgi:hypothetical protein